MDDWERLERRIERHERGRSQAVIEELHALACDMGARNCAGGDVARLYMEYQRTVARLNVVKC